MREKQARLTRVLADLSVDLFAQCKLTFNDPGLELINGSDFTSGTAIKVEIGFPNRLARIFEGEVVAVQPLFRRDMPPGLCVVCYEVLHRLALSQMTRAFNGADDKEVATSIAQAHGFTAEAPSGTKEHVLQANVSDALFLRKLAARSGDTLRVEGKKLIIGPPPKGKDIEISGESGIRKLKVQISARSQVGEVTVHGWDANSKQEITARATPQGLLQEGAKQHGLGTLALAGGSSVPDTATAEKIAKGRLAKIAQGFVQAEGEIVGDPDVVPGAVLNLDKLGAQVDGQYRVERAAHTFDKHGYRVNFRAVWIGKKKPPGPQTRPKAAPEPAPKFEDVHLILLEVKSIGGTPLARQTCRILDAATGTQVGKLVTTDEKGILRAEVDDPAKKYRVEIVDDHIKAAMPLIQADDAPAALICEFLDESGAPVANEKVEAAAGDDKLELHTDEKGRLDAPARLGFYALTIQEHTFHAHSVPLADREKEDSLYRFVLTPVRDLHLIAIEVKGLGGTPLPRHGVRLLDPETGEPIDDWTETDDASVLRAQVPDDRAYRVEIFDDSLEGHTPLLRQDETPAVLVCHFFDDAGAPIAGEAVEASVGDEKIELRTDESGRIEAPAHLASYELKIRNHSFTAHAVPLAEKDANPYRFVVGEPRDVHVIAMEVKGLGDTSLASHKVRVVDPDTGVPVSDWLETDDKGVLHTRVPDERQYRIEIFDDAIEARAPLLEQDERPAVLLCHFVDASGAPLAGEAVEASIGGDKVELVTDGNGRIEAPAKLADYQLAIRGQTFTAHSVPTADCAKDENLYRFILESK